MTAPRHIAHDKTFWQEKKHQAEAIAPGSAKSPQSGKRARKEHAAFDDLKSTGDAAPIPTEEKALKPVCSAVEAAAIGRPWP